VDGSARRRLWAILIASLVVGGCSVAGGTLGGREKCWPDAEARSASLWRGVLRIDARGARLATPEGDVIPLAEGALAFRIGSSGSGELVRGGDVVARSGDDVSLFGGAGSDGFLVVCAVEEHHQSG
jgi:hypothetical protein